jgi:(p)ppGpp synthase/HD superfamily hydrolase
MILEAKDYAIKAHKDQRYGEYPYSYHLNMVVNNLVTLWPDVSQDVIVAAWLHDVVEDCSKPIDEIEALFGPYVAVLVGLVTDCDGANRKERHEKTYPRIAGNLDACKIKLADRLANSQFASQNNPGMLKMYKKEYPYFKQVLFKEELAQAFEALELLL